jgi:hypothetical protein
MLLLITHNNILQKGGKNCTKMLETCDLTGNTLYQIYMPRVMYQMEKKLYIIISRNIIIIQVMKDTCFVLRF